MFKQIANAIFPHFKRIFRQLSDHTLALINDKIPQSPLSLSNEAFACTAAILTSLELRINNVGFVDIAVLSVGKCSRKLMPVKCLLIEFDFWSVQNLMDACQLQNYINLV